MKIEIRVTRTFQRQAKRLMKKYSSLKKELQVIEEKLKNDPTTGTSLGNNTYKIRLAVSSKGKGKSGGLRLITFLESTIIRVIEKTENNLTTIYLITIYDKSETDSIYNKELKDLINSIKE